MRYHKLVRDGIPDLIRKNGDKPIFHVANDREYVSKLKDKLEEEVAEFRRSMDVEELADVLEVVYALGARLGYSMRDLERIRSRKAKHRGGFAEGIILEETR